MLKSARLLVAQGCNRTFGGLNKPLLYLLAWQDSFRTFDWLADLPDPATIIKQVRQLLALAQ